MSAPGVDPVTVTPWGAKVTASEQEARQVVKAKLSFSKLPGPYGTKPIRYDYLGQFRDVKKEKSTNYNHE